MSTQHVTGKNAHYFIVFTLKVHIYSALQLASP